MTTSGRLKEICILFSIVFSERFIRLITSFATEDRPALKMESGHEFVWHPVKATNATHLNIDNIFSSKFHHQMAIKLKTADLAFFLNQSTNGTFYKECYHGSVKENKKNKVLDTLRHLVSNSCIKTTFLFFDQQETKWKWTWDYPIMRE